MLPGTESQFPRVVGRYTVYGKIASGGMATVHLGRLMGPVGFSRTVAIKRMLPHFAEDPEFVTMFLDEARLAARIRHPNVVPTLDVVSAENELFLVMDYVQGETLARLLYRAYNKGSRIPVPVAGSILTGALHGLHAAHEARNEHGEPMSIVHRDISPQNIIVGVDGIPRVLDFGVAKAAGRLHTTRTGQLKGKIPYMAPELLRGGKPSRRSDIFSSAVVLWESLTGERLFDGDNEPALLALVTECKVEPPSSRVPGLPKDLDDVVMRGLQRLPEGRFPTARAMATAIEECVPVAIPSAVAAWVEQIAGDALARQAARVAQIEDGSDVQSDLTDLVSAVAPAPLPVRSSPSGPQFQPALPTGTPAPSASSVPSAPVLQAQSRPDIGPEGHSQISSISVSTSVGRVVHAKRLALAIGAGLVAAGIAVALALWVRSGPATAPGESGRTAAASASAAAPVASVSAEPSAQEFSSAAAPGSVQPQVQTQPPSTGSTAAPAPAVGGKKKPASTKGGVLFRNPG